MTFLTNIMRILEAQVQTVLVIGVFWARFYFLLFENSPRGEWANPGGTAIPGQPVGKSEQAPVSSPRFKNQFNIVDPQWGSYQILS